MHALGLRYFGPRGDAPAFFAKLGHPLPAYYNPADFYIRCLAVKIGDDAVRKESQAEIKKICDRFAAESKAPVFAGSDSSGQPMLKLEDLKPGFTAASCVQFSELYRRARCVRVRVPMRMRVRVHVRVRVRVHVRVRVRVRVRVSVRVRVRVRVRVYVPVSLECVCLYVRVSLE